MAEQQHIQHPEAKAQDHLYERIINNLSQLNGNIAKVNEQLMKAQECNDGSVLVSQLWEGYMKNAEFHLLETNNLDEPIKE